MLDILLDNNGDVLEIDLTANIVEQDKRSIITSHTGDYMNHPDIGLNAIDFLNDTGVDNTFCREVNKQCAVIGMKVNAVSLDNGRLIIDADYEN